MSLGVLAAVLALLVSCGSVDEVEEGYRVQATTAGLTLDGQPWWPTGFNAYQLTTDWEINTGCGAMVDLDAYFSRLPDQSLTRFNLFASLVVDKDTGLVDYRRADEVFATAERHDQLLVPVLAAGDGACGTERFKDHSWYIERWRTEPAIGGMTFAQWLTRAVDRWTGRPALAGWELVGEPEPGRCPGADTTDCHEHTARSCPSDAADVLRGFFDEAGALLREHDDRTPIWLGLIGGGQCGTAGDEYERVIESPFIDVANYHDYGSDGVPLPGDEFDGLAARLAAAERAGKPLVVTEIGQYAGSCLSLVERSEDIWAKVIGQREAGTAGALFWAFVPDPRPTECTYDIGPDDPLWELLEQFPSR